MSPPAARRPQGGCLIDDVETPVVPDEIELRPFYHDVKHGIVQPKQVVLGTRYFWENWAPRLKPTLTTLIVRLRMHCYYNQETQERRDWCFPTQQTLAEEVGVSRWTVMRELKRPEARQFVRVQYRSRYDPARKLTVRISSLYHVAMDDPLIAEDHGRATVLAAEYMLAQAEQREDVKCGITDPGREVAERPLTGPQAKRLITQIATGPGGGKLPPKDVLEEITQPVDAVTRELIDAHVTPVIAQQLAHSFPAEKIREKMDLVRQLAEQQVELRNAPGFLRRAIEHDYPVLAATGTDGQAAAPLLTLRQPIVHEEVNDDLVELPVAPVAVAAFSGSSENPNPWQAAKQRLAADMRTAAFEQWLAPSKLLHYELGHMSVVVPDARVQRYLEQRLRKQIERTLAGVCGGPTNLEVIVEGA